MPFWNFFAFDSNSAAEAMLQPVQQAIRNRNLSLWRKLFERLYAEFSPESTTVGKPALSAESIPDEADSDLRWRLQVFVQQMAEHRLRGNFPRLRHWVCYEISWPRVLKSQVEIDQMEAFKRDVIARKESLPDPFWCLESNSCVDSNYVAPEVVRRIAATESVVGLFRKLGERMDLDPERQGVAREVARAGALIDVAASRGLALYFYEDET
jgi:hypothetical protein